MMSNSSPSKARPPLSNHSYTVPCVHSACTLTPGNSYSPSARLASARALLRHQRSIDNSHSLVRSEDGLHPMYIAVHGSGEAVRQDRHEIKQLMDETRRDVFDAVRRLFHLC